ncbi:hypothetical protein PUNSTDRAFT_140224 [Punctularia strigosozonata HHB-11173 SS5]|uniref:uncharacterized protein n=1 Tax=Punctularia strigosozonata (strain HHB-11173) TaxID=741275 RepID=UPI0004417274|nr:uncharacterized protein PUNSTDRAFT_140224 [Punctularia strigosozonata HHB-11173 SS5]EIN13757.1 hypothetical protein PUNSTDRAFT_140224 [Punctularia strigosozonata HHB-11173 SS5]
MSRFVAPLRSGAPLRSPETTPTPSSAEQLLKPPPIHPLRRRVQASPEASDSSSSAVASPSASQVTLASLNQGDVRSSSATAETLRDYATQDEAELSEDALRKIYDDEEIDRFLTLFSAYVNEVRLPGLEPPTSLAASTFDVSQDDDLSVQSPTLANDDAQGEGELDKLNPVPNSPTSATSQHTTHRSLCEEIASRIASSLPPTPPSPPPFTLGRLRLATQRLYLALEPTYILLIRLLRLATWEDRAASTSYCIVYWILWASDLLLPGALLCILYALVRRRIFPYPTLAELRLHRSQVDRAERFSDAIQSRLSASSTLGVKEAWRIFRVVYRSKKGLVDSAVRDAKSAKGKRKSTGSGEAGVSSTVTVDLGSSQGLGDLAAGEGAETVLDSPVASQEEQDLKRMGLQLINGIADVQERVKNIFLWRRPAASRLYGLALVFMFSITLLLPARYLAKLVYFIIGVMFWHATPVIMAMSPSMRDRLPPPFSNVPTDADYAMELMAERVANGLDVRPSLKTRRRRNAAKRKSTTASTSSLSLSSLSDMSQGQPGEDQEGDQDDEEPLNDESRRPKDWVRTAVNMFSTSKAWVNEGQHIVQGLRSSSRIEQQPSPPVPPVALAYANTTQVEKHPFLAQHSKGPGLITLTGGMFFFTPVVQSHGKLSIPLAQIRGIKKTGALQGLSIRWVDEENQEKLDRFLWVRGRDEAFARLIGGSAKGWIRV